MADTIRNSIAAAWRRVARAIPKGLLFLICCAAALTVLAIGFSEYHYSSTLSGLDRLSTERNRIGAVENILSLLIDAENGQRGYLLTGKTEYLQALDDANVELAKIQNRLAIGFADRPAEMSSADEIRQLASRKLIDLQTGVQLYKLGETQKALEMFNSGQGMQMTADVRGKVTELAGQLRTEFTANRENWRQQMITARVGMLSVALLNILLLLFVVILLTRESEQREYISRLVDADNLRLNKEVAERTMELDELTRHLQVVAEKDKAALARDLHDELGGILTSAKMDVEWLRTHRNDQDAADRRYQQLSALLDEAVSVKRRVIENLRPSLLDNLGLAPALEWYLAENCKKAGLAYELDIPEDLDFLTSDESIALYRIAQEALTNVLRHANAKHFSARICVDAGVYRLELADDGRGFAAPINLSKLSHGLSGMRQRARSLGGEIAWKSEPGAGTTITVTIPRAGDKKTAAHSPDSFS